MAVNALGGRAISVTGAQAGILTDRVHTKAKIANITPRQIQELLADDYIVIVAGFQGQNAGRRNDNARPRRLRSDRDRARRRARTPTPARFLPTSMASSPAIRASSPTQRKSTRSLTTNCSRWRAPAQRSCNRARSSSRKNSASHSKCDPVSKAKPGTIAKEQTTNMEDVVVRGVSIDRKQAKVTVDERAATAPASQVAHFFRDRRRPTSSST